MEICLAKLRTAALAAATMGAGVFAISIVSGLFYEQAQRALDREHFPQIGRSLGARQPAVIFVQGRKTAISETGLVQVPKPDDNGMKASYPATSAYFAGGFLHRKTTELAQLNHARLPGVYWSEAKSRAQDS